MFRKMIVASTLALALGSAYAAPTNIGSSLYVNQTGDVKVTFTGSDAAYTDVLGLYSPTNGLGAIFTNHTTPAGTVFDLGSFVAGTKLTFDLFVTNTHNTFFSGASSINPDNVGHAAVSFNELTHIAQVGFEDLYNGGDKDYNDLMFSVSNVSKIANVSPVPEAGTWGMFIAGLALMGYCSRRKKIW